MVLEYHHFTALMDEWIETSISNGCCYHKKRKNQTCIPTDEGTQHCLCNTLAKNNSMNN